MMNRENIINSILNESWDDDRCYNDYDYYDANGFDISECDIDEDIDCSVSFFIEKALERALSNMIEPRRINEVVARIIGILKNDGAQIILSKMGEKLLTFDSHYSWNDMHRYENGFEAPEDVYDDIMNILIGGLRKVAQSLPLDVEMLSEQLDEEMMRDDDLIIIDYDVDLEEYAKDYWEDSEATRLSDEADYLSWRRS